MYPSTSIKSRSSPYESTQAKLEALNPSLNASPQKLKRKISTLDIKLTNENLRLILMKLQFLHLQLSAELREIKSMNKNQPNHNSN